MKGIRVGVLLWLSICMGLIPSCKPKNSPDAQSSRPTPEILLTLQRQAETATAPNDRTIVTINSGQGSKDVPLKDESTILDIVRATQVVHKNRTIAVIRADPNEPCLSLTRLIRIVARGNVKHFRFEANRLTTAFSLPPDLGNGLTAAPWNPVKPELELVPCRILVSDTNKIGLYKITGVLRRVVGSIELARTLTEIRASYGPNRAKFIIIPAPNAIWASLVGACKAARAAGIEYPMLAEGDLQDHQIPREYLPARKTPERKEQPAGSGGS